MDLSMASKQIKDSSIHVQGTLGQYKVGDLYIHYRKWQDMLTIIPSFGSMNIMVSYVLLTYKLIDDEIVISELTYWI